MITSKIIRLLRELPFREFLALCRSVVFVYSPYYVYLFNDNWNSDHNVKSEEDVKIEKGRIAELDKLQNRLSPLPWEFQCHLQDGVNEFFVAKNSQGIQHISWIYFAEHPNRLLSLQTDEVEIKYCLTLPPFRGRGIYPEVIRHMISYLSMRDVKRIFMCVRRNNLPSIRGIEKAGFRRVGKFRLIRILGVQVSSRLNTSSVD
jgi:RimJ/RimL family protein N-acetyltransferase